MTYNPPAGNITTSVDMFTWVNSVVSNWFFPAMIIGVWFIITIKMMFNPNATLSKAFSLSSFVCLIISVFSRVLGFVDTNFMGVFIVLTAVGVMWMHIDNTYGVA